jgi:hypothetical protein
MIPVNVTSLGRAGTFASYIPDEAVTPSQPVTDKGSEQNNAVTENKNVTAGKPQNPGISNGCDGVTANILHLGSFRNRDAVTNSQERHMPMSQ